MHTFLINLYNEDQGTKFRVVVISGVSATSVHGEVVV